MKKLGVKHPNFEITHEDVEDTQAETIFSIFSNKNLIKYDYTKNTWDQGPFSKK